MNTRPTSGLGQAAWWASMAAVLAVVMVLKPFGALTAGEGKWLAGGLGVVMLWRIVGLLRSSSTSPGRILLMLVGLAMLGSVGVVGVPANWFRVPAWSEVSGVVMPLILGAAGLGALLFGLAKLNYRREMEGAPQRSYLPIALNLVIVAAAWQVVRQPLWKDSLRGMMMLPQLHSNRVALEASLAPWGGVIERGSAGPASRQPSASDIQGSTAVTAMPGPESDRKTVVSTHPLGAALIPGASMVVTPSNAEQWIQAAVHNASDPLLELRASVALVAQDRHDQALRRLEAARDRGCTSPELSRFHSRLLQSKGRPAAAATVMEALVLSPNGTDQDLHECLGSWEQAGQMDRAESLAERLLVRRPSRDLFRWLAARDASEGRFERALVLLGQLSRRTPFDPEDAIQLAEVALRAGRPELTLDAVSLLEEAGHRSARSRRLAEKAKASPMAESSRLATVPARGAGG